MHEELNEAVFVKQSKNYEKKDEEHKVYKMKKAFYNLKQAPHDFTVFIKTWNEGKILIVSLYVDDLIFIGNDGSMFIKFKNSMKLEFDMTNLGKMRYFFLVWRSYKSLKTFILIKKYEKKVLKFRVE